MEVARDNWCSSSRGRAGPAGARPGPGGPHRRRPQHRSPVVHLPLERRAALRPGCDRHEVGLRGLLRRRRRGGPQRCPDARRPAGPPVSAEEDGGAGSFAVLSDGLDLAPGSAALIAEPTDGRIFTANAGCLTFRIALRGRAAHGALRWRGVNPIEHVAPMLDALRELEARRCAGAGALFDDWPLAYPISVGTVSGGNWASTVPDAVTLTGRYGVRLGESFEQAQAQFEAAVADVARSHPWLAVHPPTVTWWGARFASAQTPSEHPLVGALTRAGAPKPGSGRSLRVRPAPAQRRRNSRGPVRPRAARRCSQRTGVGALGTGGGVRRHHRRGSRGLLPAPSRRPVAAPRDCEPDPVAQLWMGAPHPEQCAPPVDDADCVRGSGHSSAMPSESSSLQPPAWPCLRPDAQVVAPPRGSLHVALSCAIW